MRIGVVFPQTEIGTDPGAIRDYAQSAEALGYDHILAYDHVLGANAASRPGWGGAYQHTDMFHEPFVLFGYLSGCTSRIELATGIMILPQRQTALVAKQAAAADILSGGRLRFGIGVGWNDVEYEALGEDFGDRGRRTEEQVGVLKALWTRQLVTYDGRWHKITDAGINPLPVQRPIPLWFGGGAWQVIRRIGRWGDGWIMPGYSVYPSEQTWSRTARIHEHARQAGRDPAAVGLEKVVSIDLGPPEEWSRVASAWRDEGASHFTVNTMNAGLATPDDHIDAI